MSFPCPPAGGIITLKTGLVVPVGIPPALISRVPYVYPVPPFDTETDSIYASALTTTVAFPPIPSPFIGTFEYVCAFPSPAPLSLMVIILI